LSTAFTSPNLPRRSVDIDQSVGAMSESSAEIPAEKPPTQSGLDGSASTDLWKEEYNSHVASWRAESAAQRERAETERARWTSIREEEERNRQEPASRESSWGTVSYCYSRMR
jgi:hypothetical protein